MTAGHRRGLRLQDDAVDGLGGYRRKVRTTSDDRARRQRPPLTRRMSPRHWAALDCVAGVITTAVLFESIRQSLNQPVPFTFGQARYVPLALAGPMALLLVLVAGAAVALRRRNPTLMLTVLLVSSVLVTALTGPDAGSLTYFLPVAYVLYLVASTYRTRRDAGRVLAAVFVTLIADNALMAVGWHGFFAPGALIPVTLGLTISWTIGYTARQRRSYAVRLQDEAASKAVAQERLRIARELHDVVAHSMSVIAVQAGYGQYVIDSQPDDARAALGAIQATSREALDEMRRMLGALRQADESEAAGSGGARAIARLSGRRVLRVFPRAGRRVVRRVVRRLVRRVVRRLVRRVVRRVVRRRSGTAGVLWPRPEGRGRRCSPRPG